MGGVEGMEWKEVRLGDVCTAIVDNRGKSAPTSEEGTYPLLEVNCIGNYRPDYSSVRKYVTEDVYNNWFRSGHPKYGDILIPTVGSIGILSLMDNRESCIAQNVIALRVDDQLAINEYIYYYLKTPRVKREMLNLNIGGVQPSIKVPHLKNLEINLPPLSTQRRISSVLSSLDRKIELNNKINATLEEMAQALFKSWFVDFEPFKNGNFIDSEIGKIPEGWRVGSFRELIDILPGGTPKTTMSEYWENGTIPFFSPKDVGTSVYCFDTEKHITELGLTNCNSRLYPKDTLFITARGTVGKVALAAVPMAMNQSNYALAAKEGIGKYFLYFLTKSLVAILLKKANGAVFSAITTKDFNEIIIVPSAEAISAFECKMKPIFGEVYKLSQETLTLSHLRDTLLPRLMSGEIEV